MALSTSDQQHWEQEQIVLNAARLAQPELFTPVVKEPGVLFSRVGMSVLAGVRPSGYIKYSPLDFIVEEIRPSGGVVFVDGETAESEYPDGEGTVYADMIKVGISTLDAVQRIAGALSIDLKKIGYAGIKDAVALTSQRISLRGVTIVTVQNCRVPNVILRNVVERKGAIGVGNLTGNRFTLFIRTQQAVDSVAFEKQVDTIRQHGIMNYYGVQRFGTPRFLAHVF